VSEAKGTMSEDHVCFDCRRQIRSYEPHIHCGLDEAMSALGTGAKPLGLDGILLLAFCVRCTEPGGPFEADMHEITPRSAS